MRAPWHDDLADLKNPLFSWSLTARLLVARNVPNAPTAARWFRLADQNLTIDRNGPMYPFYLHRAFTALGQIDKATRCWEAFCKAREHAKWPLPEQHRTQRHQWPIEPSIPPDTPPDHAVILHALSLEANGSKDIL